MKLNTIKILIPILFLFSLLFSSGCEDTVSPEELIDNERKVTINQGAWGSVRFWEGDFMPMYDESTGGTITPVVRDIYIHVATNDDMVDREGYGGFYSSINSELIAIIQSDKDGFFQIELAPAKYSFFIMEDSLFYGSRLDGEGYIEAEEIFKDSTTQLSLDITYKATY